MKSFWLVFVSSLFLATLLTLLPLPVPYRPAWLLITVIYWILKFPHRVGIGTAAVLGLLLDSLQGVLLGENMLCFIIIAYVVIKMQRQLIQVNIFLQIFSLLLLVLLNQMLLLLIESLQRQPVSLAWFFGSLILSALAWPLMAGCIDRSLKKHQIHR